MRTLTSARARATRSSQILLVCPHQDDLQHRIAKIYGTLLSDGRLKPSGVDAFGRKHFRCVVCGHHITL